MFLFYLNLKNIDLYILLLGYVLFVFKREKFIQFNKFDNFLNFLFLTINIKMYFELWLNWNDHYFQISIYGKNVVNNNDNDEINIRSFIYIYIYIYMETTKFRIIIA